jgi:predicted ester cyclase
MSAENNKGIVRRFFEGALGKGNERDTEVLDPHCTLNAPGFFTGEISDRDGVGNIVEQIRTAFPDLDITIKEPETTESGDVVTRWKGTGTHTGRIEHLEPTGASLEWWGQSVSRLSGDKIVEMWWSTISNTIDGNWSAMELDSVIEVVPADERLAPDVVYKKPGPKPTFCSAVPWCYEPPSDEEPST